MIRGTVVRPGDLRVQRLVRWPACQSEPSPDRSSAGRQSADRIVLIDLIFPTPYSTGITGRSGARGRRVGLSVYGESDAFERPEPGTEVTTSQVRFTGTKPSSRGLWPLAWA